MSQVLSTFNTTEQDRFAAFRRSAFASDAISDYVAYCLVKHSNEANRQRRKGLELGAEDLGISSPSSSKIEALTSEQPLSSVAGLKEYVAPGTASRISLIVGTISKIYAQRLVKSARNVATEKGMNSAQRILPEHVMEAHIRRSNAGVDPGFYMQPKTQGIAPPSNFKASLVKRKMDEALAAQNVYDNARGE